MAVATQSVTELCRAAKAAARELATLDSGTKDRALLAVAGALEARTPEILEANARDLEAGRESGLSAALMDRLALSEERIAGMARGVRDIVALPDPVGEVIDGHRLPNGLDVRKVRVPLGVVAVVYEARPNVTIDAAALCLKSGNAILLRGSSSATHSNAVLAAIAAEAAEGAGLPAGALGLVAGGGREELAELADPGGPRRPDHPARRRGPEEGALRGREGAGDLRRVGQLPRLRRRERRPRARGRDRPERQDAAAGRVQRGRDAARPRGRRGGVPARARCARSPARASSCAATSGRGRSRPTGVAVGEATDEDYATEFLALILAVKVVDSVEEAIDHVETYGSGHSEAILTGSTAAARAFQLGVDAACVYVNASTRFTDGGEFGMGAEIGNSTQKLHARGPIGLRELCTFKYLVEGDGHLRRLRLGLLGGTFNPPHLGHLVCAQEALLAFGLDRVLLVPAGVPPHKQVEARPGRRAPRRDVRGRGGGRRAPRRLARGRRPRRPGVHGRAAAGAAGGVARGRARASSSAATWRTRCRRGGSRRRCWRWRGSPSPSARAWRATTSRSGSPALRGADERVAFFAMPRIDISSSLIRRRVAAGLPVRYLVPDAVAAHIGAATACTPPILEGTA